MNAPYRGVRLPAMEVNEALEYLWPRLGELTA
jgi:hypothetical protein